MAIIFIEHVDEAWAVYAPGTTRIAAVMSLLDETLAYVRAEWPALGVRLVRSMDTRDLLPAMPSKCVASD